MKMYDNHIYTDCSVTDANTQLTQCDQAGVLCDLCHTLSIYNILLKGAGKKLASNVYF